MQRYTCEGEIRHGSSHRCDAVGNIQKNHTKPQTKPSNTVLRAYEGQRVTHIGKCQLECSVNGRYKQCEFYMINSESPPILRLSMCANLRLITRGVKGVEAVTTQSINSTYKHVCNGLGCFEAPYHNVVEQDTVPVKEPPRRIPFGLQDRLKIKLDLMEKQGHTGGQQTHRLGTQSCDCGEERRILETLSRP